MSTDKKMPGVGSTSMQALVMFNILFMIFSHSLIGQCISPLRDGDFEEARKGYLNRSKWIREGSAGIEVNAGKSFHGNNNGWVTSAKGWNAIRQAIFLEKDHTYTLTAFIKTSPNISDGYFGFRDVTQHPVSEIKFGSLPVYRELTVRFKPGVSGKYYIFSGIWAPAQTGWIRLDDVRVSFPCEDVQLNPVNN